MNSVVSVASLASASAIASPSIAADPTDPIFSVIDDYKAAYGEFDAFEEVMAAARERCRTESPRKWSSDRFLFDCGNERVVIAEISDIAELRRARRISKQMAADLRDDLIVSKHYYAKHVAPLVPEEERISARFCGATDRLFEVKPQTASGMLALLTFVLERNAVGDNLVDLDEQTGTLLRWATETLGQVPLCKGE